MTKNYNELMDMFCDIMLPHNKKKRGYRHRQSTIESLDITTKTYRNWINKKSAPNLKKFTAMLNERGYKIVIQPNYER